MGPTSKSCLHMRLAALLAAMMLVVAYARADTVPLEKDGGNYRVPVLINNALTLKFLLDTGASDVAIPGDVVSTLIRTGTVARTDFVGTGIYVLADGSKLPSARFIIRELKIGGHAVTNVTASVAPVKGELLLGQSALSKLPPWSIDYQMNALDIRGDAGPSRAQEGVPPQVPPAHQPAASRWVELRYSDDTVTYDLETIRMIQPGRFTVLSTTVDLPEVMRFRLKVLDTLRTYCSKPDGKYEPPSDLFLLGTPDMLINKIEVTTGFVNGTAGRFKAVRWRLPYRKMAIGAEENIGFFNCEEKEYNELRAIIMNGITGKELYDCNNGVMGMFVNVEDPPSKAIPTANIRGGFMEAYLRLCYVITGQPPFLSPNSK